MLIEAGKTFVRRIVRVRGIEQVALIGSLATEESNPKDIDFLLTVSASLDIQAAATAGRKLKGHLQGYASGADVFLCNQAHEYIGRTCNYRECHTRVACLGADCRPGSWLNTDFQLLKLEQSSCKNPPVILWPLQELAVPVPEDVRQMLEDLRIELEEQGRVA